MSQLSKLLSNIVSDAKKEGRKIFEQEMEKASEKLEQKAKEKLEKEKPDKKKDDKSKQKNEPNKTGNTQSKPEDKKQSKSNDLLKVRIAIQETAERIVNDRLDKLMKHDIDEVKKKYGLKFSTPKAITDIKAIIRGHNTIKINQEDIILRAKQAVERKLEEHVNDQVRHIESSYEKQVNKRFDKTQKQINYQFSNLEEKTEKAQTKIEKLPDKLTEEALTKRLDSIVAKATDLKATTKKIDGMLNKIGLSVDTSSMLKPILSDIDKNITTKLQNHLMPMIQKQIEHIKVVSTVLKKIDETIKKAKEKVNEYINSFKEKATNYIKNKVGELAGNALSSIKLKL